MQLLRKSAACDAFTFNLYKQLIVMHNAARQVWKQAHRLWVMLIEFEDEVSHRQIVCDFIPCYNYSCKMRVKKNGTMLKMHSSCKQMMPAF